MMKNFQSNLKGFYFSFVTQWTTKYFYQAFLPYILKQVTFLLMFSL